MAANPAPTTKVAYLVEPKPRRGSIKSDAPTGPEHVGIESPPPPLQRAPTPPPTPKLQGQATFASMIPRWKQSKIPEKTQLPELPSSLPLLSPPPMGCSAIQTWSRSGKPTSQDQCNHSTLTRTWSNIFLCNRCGRFPHWGWTFRCTDDVELQLRAAPDSGRGFPLGDKIHRDIVGSIVPAKNGPEARACVSSLAEEIHGKERQKYTIKEFETIIFQRNAAHATALYHAEDIYGHCKGWDSEKPWVPPRGQACSYRLCAGCAAHTEGRTFESMNAVANGDLTMTSVVGYGFWSLGTRPVLDARIVSRLGTRPVPTKQQNLGSADLSTLQTNTEIPRKLADKSPVAPTPDQSSREREIAPPVEESVIEHATGLKTVQDRFPSIDKICDEKYPFRSPWSPPVTPKLGLATIVSGLGGRSDASLKTNPESKSRIISTMRTPSRGPPGLTSHIPFYETDAEMRHDVGLFQPFNKREYGKAVTTPLPAEDPQERFFLEATPMMKAERLSGTFCKEPLKVQGGFALTEESVEVAIPDVASRRTSVQEEEEEEEEMESDSTIPKNGGD